jgi:hypothetical protein
LASDEEAKEAQRTPEIQMALLVLQQAEEKLAKQLSILVDSLTPVLRPAGETIEHKPTPEISVQAPLARTLVELSCLFSNHADRIGTTMRRVEL